MRRFWKRTAAAALAVILTVSAAACGRQDSPADAGQETESAASGIASAESASAESASEESASTESASEEETSSQAEAEGSLFPSPA